MHPNPNPSKTSRQGSLKPGKLKGDAAVGVGGWGCIRGSAPRTAPSLTYHRSGKAGRPEAGHGIGTAAARAAPPCPGRSLLRLAAGARPRGRLSPRRAACCTRQRPLTARALAGLRADPRPAASGPLRPPRGRGKHLQGAGLREGLGRGGAPSGSSGPCMRLFSCHPRMCGDGSGHG